MHPRQVRHSIIRGHFLVPIGVRVSNQKEPGEAIKELEVSTVCLEGGHLEAPIRGMLDPEHGYETMVFFKGLTFFGLHQQRYETRAQAVRGHKTIIRKLLAGKLPLAIQIENYVAHEEMPAEDAQSRQRDALSEAKS